MRHNHRAFAFNMYIIYTYFMINIYMIHTYLYMDMNTSMKGSDDGECVARLMVPICI